MNKRKILVAAIVLTTVLFAGVVFSSGGFSVLTSENESDDGSHQGIVYADTVEYVTYNPTFAGVEIMLGAIDSIGDLLFGDPNPADHAYQMEYTEEQMRNSFDNELGSAQRYAETEADRAISEYFHDSGGADNVSQSEAYQVAQNSVDELYNDVGHTGEQYMSSLTRTLCGMKDVNEDAVAYGDSGLICSYEDLPDEIQDENRIGADDEGYPTLAVDSAGGTQHPSIAVPEDPYTSQEFPAGLVQVDFRTDIRDIDNSEFAGFQLQNEIDYFGYSQNRIFLDTVPVGDYTYSPDNETTVAHFIMDFNGEDVDLGRTRTNTGLLEFELQETNQDIDAVQVSFVSSDGPANYESIGQDTPLIDASGLDSDVWVYSDGDVYYDAPDSDFLDAGDNDVYVNEDAHNIDHTVSPENTSELEVDDDEIRTVPTASWWDGVSGERETQTIYSVEVDGAAGEEHIQVFHFTEWIEHLEQLQTEAQISSDTLGDASEGYAVDLTNNILDNPDGVPHPDDVGAWSRNRDADDRAEARSEDRQSYYASSYMTIYDGPVNPIDTDITLEWDDGEGGTEDYTGNLYTNKTPSSGEWSNGSTYDFEENFAILISENNEQEIEEEAEITNIEVAGETESSVDNRNPQYGTTDVSETFEKYEEARDEVTSDLDETISSIGWGGDGGMVDIDIDWTAIQAIIILLASILTIGMVIVSIVKN